MRLDIYLVENKYCVSRNKAAQMIALGKVRVNNKVNYKSSYVVKPNDLIEIEQNYKQYVARSAKKLITAIERFDLDFKNKTAVDLGASTGGFCQIMLENGAKKIYAVDIGTNQLDVIIKSDTKIIDLEKTDARTINADMFDDRIDIITCDLSFISLTHILPAVYRTLKPMGEFICLVKPQFEVGPLNVGKNGVVKDTRMHVQAVCNISDLAYDLGFDVRDACYSQLAGENGNKEFLLYMIKSKPQAALSHKIIESRVADAK